MKADGGAGLHGHRMLHEEANQTGDVAKGNGAGVQVVAHGATRLLHLSDLQVDVSIRPSVDSQQDLDEVDCSGNKQHYTTASVTHTKSHSREKTTVQAKQQACSK